MESAIIQEAMVVIQKWWQTMAESFKFLMDMIVMMLKENVKTNCTGDRIEDKINELIAEW